MEYQKENVKLICADNMEIMAQYPDKYFDLLIADPPYGINADKNAYKNGINCKKHDFKEHKQTNWDVNIPDSYYFK